jgi:dTDP-4-dehydrorhamnose reductase
MRILLLGRDGQLGRAMLQTLTANASPISPDHLSAWGRADLDLSNLLLLRERLNTLRPTLVINAAAYTQVDAAQTQPELAHRINAQVPELLAHYAHLAGASLMHFSTDYVFAGDRVAGYSEEDPCAPINVYGESKYAGELAIKHLFAASTPHPQARYAIFRTSWLYGEGNNFIRTILQLAQVKSELRVVSDQWGVPTGARWLADTSLALVTHVSQEGLIARPFTSGVYHAVPDGQTNWYGLAQVVIASALRQEMRLQVPTIEAIVPISSEEMPRSAKRPAHSVLQNAKLKSECTRFGLGGAFPPWEDLVDRYVQSLQ